jgi:hypothetical protein
MLVLYYKLIISIEKLGIIEKVDSSAEWLNLKNGVSEYDIINKVEVYGG